MNSVGVVCGSVEGQVELERGPARFVSRFSIVVSHPR